MLESVSDRSVMKRQHSNFASLLMLFLITVMHLCISNTSGNSNNHKGCAYLHCENGDQCVHRKFRCKNPPCPSMLYCSKSRTESLRGPSTCDTVRCNRGFECIVKVRHCRWDEKCKEQRARCISQKEYYDGPACCAGFKCPAGNHCILRESLCMNPPCKLLKSCVRNKDAQAWFGKCRNLGCNSEFECFLRRPDNKCSGKPCKHMPDCISRNEKDIMNEHCRGWICPRTQTCVAQIEDPCETESCEIKRSCHETRVISSNYSFSPSRSSDEDEEKYVDVPLFNEVDHRHSRKKTLVKTENELIHREQAKRKTETGTRVEVHETDELPPRRNQENLNEARINDKRRPLHSLLNHLNSKTELDAIELWIQNAERQRDFKQFQNWLRNVRDMLGADAYDFWKKEIRTSGSRSEKFREWLLASNTPGSFDTNTDKPYVNVAPPILPKVRKEQRKVDNPRSITENKFSSNDKSSVVKQTSNSERNVEHINHLLEKFNFEKSTLEERDLMDVIKSLVVPRTILLPPYSALEMALIDHLSESPYSTLLNYKPKYPSSKDLQILLPHLSRIRNVYGQPYYLLPIKDLKESVQSDPYFGVQNYDVVHRKNDQSERIPINNESANRIKDISSLVNEQYNWDSISLKDQLSFLLSILSKNLTKLDEDITTPSAGNLHYDDENHSKSPIHDRETLEKLIRTNYNLETETGMYRIDKGHADNSEMPFTDVSSVSLEELMKFLQIPTIDETKPTFKENINEELEIRNENSPPFSRNHGSAEDYNWNQLNRIYEYEDLAPRKDPNETMEIFSSEERKERIGDVNEEKLDNIFISTSGETHDSNSSDQSNDSNRSVLPSEEHNAANEDIIDQKSFTEANKENIVSHIKALIEAISQDYDFPDETELSSKESSMKWSFLNADELRGKSIKDTVANSRRRGTDRNGSISL